MYFFPTAITGISLVLAIFLIAVTARTISRFHSPIFKYLLAVFVILLLDSAYTVLSILLFPALRTYDAVIYIISDFFILILFYAAIAKGR